VSTVLMNGMVVYLVDRDDTRHLTAFIAGLRMTKMHDEDVRYQRIRSITLYRVIHITTMLPSIFISFVNTESSRMFMCTTTGKRFLCHRFNHTPFRSFIIQRAFKVF